MARHDNDFASSIGQAVYKKYKDDIFNSFVNAYEQMVYDVYEDAFQLYAKAIDQYYRYKTTSYIRHGEGKPGTRKGTNLHEANRTHIANWSSSNPYRWRVIVEWNAAWMYPYKKAEVTQDYVLSNVINGIRGIPTESAPTYWGEKGHFHGVWSASIYLHNTKMKLEGTPLEMLDKFQSNSKEACRKLLNKHWETNKKTLINKIMGGKSWLSVR